MHPALTKDSLFYRKAPPHFALFFTKYPRFSTFFTKNTPPPFHFLPIRACSDCGNCVCVALLSGAESGQTVMGSSGYARRSDRPGSAAASVVTFDNEGEDELFRRPVTGGVLRGRRQPANVVQNRPRNSQTAMPQTGVHTAGVTVPQDHANHSRTALSETSVQVRSPTDQPCHSRAVSEARVRTSGTTSLEDQPSHGQRTRPQSGVDAAGVALPGGRGTESRSRVRSTGMTALENQPGHGQRPVSEARVQATGFTPREGRASSQRTASQTGVQADVSQAGVRTAVSAAPRKARPSHTHAAVMSQPASTRRVLQPLSSRPVLVQDKVSRWLTSSAVDQQPTGSAATTAALSKDQGLQRHPRPD